MAPLLLSAAQRDQLLQLLSGLPAPTPKQVITVSVCITVLVSLYSLNELQQLVASSDHAAAFLPSHAGWQGSDQYSAAQTQLLAQMQAGGGGGAGAAVQQQAGSSLAGTTTAVVAAAAAAAQQPSSQAQQAAAAAPAPPAPAQCHAKEYTEMWGDVVKWGASFHTATPGECCDACLKHVPPDADSPKCNVWVWCGAQELCRGQYRECWLKHLANPRTTRPVREGEDVGWTSGIVGPDAEEPEEERPGPADNKVRRYHVITSAQGAAVHWQVRVHYYWYLKQKAACEAAPRCEMGGFTRLLHSGQPDDLMDEVPTFVAQPLPDSVVAHELYPVLNRPYAFLQWLRAANISEEYVLMSEPDHIFLRPIPNFMRKDSWPAAFPFFYIEPSKDEYVPIVAQFMPSRTLSKEDAEAMAPMGNSPTFLSMAQMRAVVPLWQNLSVEVFKNPTSNKAWGWVQEMYAFTMAVYLTGVRHVDLVLQLMAQPPWDAKLSLTEAKPYYICHYTYGNDFSLQGKFTPGKYGAWRFDKRTYVARPPPRHLGDPPPAMQNDMVRALISHINEATANIPCWDEYYRTGVRPPSCDEAIPGSIYPAPPRSSGGGSGGSGGGAGGGAARARAR